MDRPETEDLTRINRDKEARFWLAAIVESSDDPIIGKTIDGTVISWNQAAERLYGYAAKEVIGKSYSVLVPPDRPDELPALLSMVKRGEVVDHHETVKVAKDGQRINVSLTISPIKDSEGNVMGASTIARDVTEAKRIEQERERAERKLSRLAGELEIRNRELSYKNEEIEAFVYGISHDLRSPLVNLEGFSQELALVARDIREILEGGDLPAETRRRALELVDDDMGTSIGYIQTGVRRLSGIIDALLRLSRVGRTQYQLQRVDLNPVVERVVGAMNATIVQRQASVTVSDLPPAWGDATQLEQVFANLIGNALNYLDPERPGVIEVGCKEPESSESTDVDRVSTSGSHTYYVKDNGVGIPEHGLDKVFQVFQRFHPERSAGEGMGLTLAQRIVERHGGRVWVESTDGEGSTFFVALPSEGGS
ncbi:MAG TPA: PAS domain S-box protein [Rubrobacteraceae bacterium]|nr:PAS domain S-box protein [Rubrobacteraceae bacterium]